MRSSLLASSYVHNGIELSRTLLNRIASGLQRARASQNQLLFLLKEPGLHWIHYASDSFSSIGLALVLSSRAAGQLTLESLNVCSLMLMYVQDRVLIGDLLAQLDCACIGLLLCTQNPSSRTSP